MKLTKIFPQITSTLAATVALSSAIAANAFAATMTPTPLIFDDDGSQRSLGCKLQELR